MSSVTRYELVDDTDKFEIETGSWSGGTLLLSLVVIKVCLTCCTRC